MPSIIKISHMLEAEIDRLHAGSQDDLDGAFSSLEILDFAQILETITNHKLRVLLLQWMDPFLIKDTMTFLNIQTLAECLNIMKEERRLEVVKLFAHVTKARILKGLEHWQMLMEINYSAKFLPLRVMCNEFPPHYPVRMRACVICGKGFEKWQSIIIADCNAHSFHENCEEEEGICPKCTI